MRITPSILAAALALLAGCRGSDRDVVPADAPGAVAASPGDVLPIGSSGWNEANILGFIRASSGVLAGDGEAAEHRAQSAAVKQFGERLAREQRALFSRADSLARRLDVDPMRPEGSGFIDEHEQTMRELQGASGADFERRYLEHVTDALERALEQMDGVSNSGRAPLVVGLLNEARTTLRAELDAARRLRDDPGRR